MTLHHLHLVLNHFPLIALVLSVPFFLVGQYLKKNSVIVSALFLVLIGGMMAIPTYLTGEAAEESIESTIDERSQFIEAHEEAAEKTIWVVMTAGLSALVALYWAIKKKEVPTGILLGVIFLVFSSIFLAGLTSNLGGQISHRELRHSTKLK